MSNNYYEKNNYEEFYNEWNDCDNGCRNRRNDDCCNKNDDPCPGFDRRPIRRCDEEAIEREINRLFKFILNELCDVEQDVDVISRAFVRLAKLLVEDTCLEASEEALICCVANDLKALQVLVDKTIRDVKCLRKDVKC